MNNSPSFSTNRTLGVTTAPEIEWLDPYIVPPPKNSGILLLTWDNIMIAGTWGNEGHKNYAAWAPRLSRAAWLKQRMYAHYTGQYVPKPIEG